MDVYEFPLSLQRIEGKGYSVDKRYLGDGVYVQSTAFGEVELTTENGMSVQNRIILDPFIVEELEKYFIEWWEEAHK